MASEKETWVAKEVDKPVETQSAPAMAAKAGKPFFEQLCDLVNIFLTIAVAGLIAAGGYFSYPVLNRPSFTEAQGYFQERGDTEAGEHLAELARVCQDGAKTKLACKLVYYGGLAELKDKQPEEEISQAKAKGGTQ